MNTGASSLKCDRHDPWPQGPSSSRMIDLRLDFRCPRLRVAWLVLLSVGCESKPSAPGAASAGGQSPAASATPGASAAIPSPSAKSYNPFASVATPTPLGIELPPPAVPGDAGPGAGVVTPDWVVDEPTKFAVAASITATERGVVMINKDQNVYLAKLGKLPVSASPKKTSIGKVTRRAGRFPIGHGPALYRDYVYYIRDGELRRRHFPISGATGPIEVLRRDAADGTRVSAPVEGSRSVANPGAPPSPKSMTLRPATIGYVRRAVGEKGEPQVAVWIDGHDSYVLTPDGAASRHISLANLSRGILSIAFQGRRGMTPVHARWLSFPKGHPELSDDVVLWVGGPSQRQTELVASLDRHDNLVALIPLERGISTFGLHALALAADASRVEQLYHYDYKNGVDPAPLASGTLCGEHVVVFARPQTSGPQSEQELALMTLAGPRSQIPPTAGKAADSVKGLPSVVPSRGDRTESGGSVLQSALLATGKTFYNVSVAILPRGLLVTYTENWLSQAVTVRCR